jgi:hypothetical protein
MTGDANGARDDKGEQHRDEQRIVEQAGVAGAITSCTTKVV